MANKRRADGLIQRQVTINGRRKSFYGHSEREINRKIIEYKEERRIGRTFAVIADEWEAEHFPTLEYNTLKGYKPALRRAVSEFGQLPCKQITPQQVQLFLNRFAAHGYAQKTVKTQLLVLHLTLEHAVIKGDIDINPSASVRIPKGLPKKKREIPSENETQKVKENINATFGLFAFFILYTGCRRGEALALSYEDIDFDKHLISVGKSVYHDNNTPHIKQPKTKAGYRYIPLLKPLARVLNQSGKGLLFANEQGHLLSETQFQRQWELYCKESGITVTPHQLRHAYATILFEAGLTDKDAQEILGHANIQTTRDIYTHITEKRFAESAAKLDRFVE